MKNIHILPTDKPSRLHFTAFEEELVFTPQYEKLDGVNIYITSNEEIKEGEYCITKTNEVIRFKKSYTQGFLYKKIIITTDKDLIKDGVQAIDDEFLEWFVKNSSCEEVEVVKEDWKDKTYSYEIIIPKEEPKKYKVMIVGNGLPKQETLEEVAERLYPTTIDSFTDTGIDMSETERLIFISGAKWQQKQEKSYNEGVICKNCKKVISVEHINNHLFMAVKSGGLIHWNCKTI